MSGIYCIMWQGTPLSDIVRDALFSAACDCGIHQKSEKRIKHDDVEGYVYTEFEHGMTGPISGIVFNAEIATEAGDSKVVFLVTTRDFEKAKNDTEARWFSLEEETAHQWN